MWVQGSTNHQLIHNCWYREGSVQTPIILISLLCLYLCNCMHADSNANHTCSWPNNSGKSNCRCVTCWKSQPPQKCVASLHVELCKSDGKHTIGYGWSCTHFSHWTVLYSNISWSQPAPVDRSKWSTTKQLAHVACSFVDVPHCVCNQPWRNPWGMQLNFHLPCVLGTEELPEKPYDELGEQWASVEDPCVVFAGMLHVELFSCLTMMTSFLSCTMHV